MKQRLLIGIPVAGLGLILAASGPNSLAANDAAKPKAANPSQTHPYGQRPPGMDPEQLAATLGLSADQTSKLEALEKTQRQKMMDLRQSNLSSDERRAKFQALREEHQKAVQSILTPEQFTKFQALQKQYGPRMGAWGGGRGIADMMPRLKAELNLTPTQEKQINSILQSADKKEKALRDSANSSGNPDQNREQIRGLRRTTMDQVRNVLTEEQRAKLQSMRGNRNNGGDNRNPGNHPAPAPKSST